MEDAAPQEVRYATSFTLQQIFNEILAGSKVKLAFSSRKEYNNMRTMLIRKFSGYKGVLKDMGADENRVAKFISASVLPVSHDGEETGLIQGEFQMKENEARIKKLKTYYVKEMT